ncbi:MAG: NADH-quinone oxidoreductase subunit C [Spirochaetaceae bacterium]
MTTHTAARPVEELLQDLSRRFDTRDGRLSHAGQAFIRVSREHAVPLIRHLRDVEGFTHLVFLTAVDVIEQGVFRLTYLLHDYAGRRDAGVEVEIPRDTAEMESIHLLWAQATTYQRELKEMFGIDFPGSPRVDEPLILESWDDIPPMRRDFDTRAYSEARYFPRPGRKKTVVREHMKRALYAEFDTPRAARPDAAVDAPEGPAAGGDGSGGEAATGGDGERGS